MSEGPLKLILSLDPYERILLDEFCSLFGLALEPCDDEVSRNGMESVFERWLWRRKVADNYYDLTHDPGLVEDMGGNMDRLWSTLMHFLNYYAFNFLHFRTNSLQAENPGFPQKLVAASSDQLMNLKVEPNRSDFK